MKLPTLAFNIPWTTVQADPVPVQPEMGYPTTGYLEIKAAELVRYLRKKANLGLPNDDVRRRNMESIIDSFDAASKNRYAPQLANFFGAEDKLKQDYEARKQIVALLAEAGFTDELPPQAHLDADEMWNAIRANLHHKHESHIEHESPITPHGKRALFGAKAIGMLPITLLVLDLFGFDPFKPFGFLIACVIAGSLGYGVSVVLSWTVFHFEDGFLWPTFLRGVLGGRGDNDDQAATNAIHPVESGGLLPPILSALFLGTVLVLIALMLPSWLQLDAHFLEKKGLPPAIAACLTRVLLPLSFAIMVVSAVVTNRQKLAFRRAEQLVGRLKVKLASAIAQHRPNLVEGEELLAIWNQKNWALGRVSETLQIAAYPGDLADPEYVSAIRDAMLQELGPRRNRWLHGSSSC